MTCMIAAVHGTQFIYLFFIVVFEGNTISLPPPPALSIVKEQLW